jgi:hypothetical protein
MTDDSTTVEDSQQRPKRPTAPKGKLLRKGRSMERALHVQIPHSLLVALHEVATAKRQTLRGFVEMTLEQAVELERKYQPPGRRAAAGG